MNFVTELKENIQPDSLVLGDCLEVMKHIPKRFHRCNNHRPSIY